MFELFSSTLHLFCFGVSHSFSERLAKSGAEGVALKEAQAINTSLSALGNVISSLQSKKGHIPYRDSKLTWLLSDCLSGQSKVVMFVQLSPVVSSSQETSCSLQFAQRARATDLGQAKKNKTSNAPPAAAGPSQADMIALKRAMSMTVEQEKKKTKEEATAAVTKAQKQLQQQTEQLTLVQSQLATLQSQLRQVEKERDTAKLDVARLTSTQTSSQNVTMISLQKELTALKEKVNLQQQQHNTSVQQKDKELKELRAKLLLPSTTSSSSVVDSSIRPPSHRSSLMLTRSSRSSSVSQSMDLTSEIEEMNNENRAMNTSTLATKGKKRRSDEMTSGENETTTPIPNKKLASSDETTSHHPSGLPVAIPIRIRPSTAAASSLSSSLPPSMTARSVSSSLTSLGSLAGTTLANGATRTTRRQATAGTSAISAPMPIAGAATARAARSMNRTQPVSLIAPPSSEDVLSHDDSIEAIEPVLSTSRRSSSPSPSPSLSSTPVLSVTEAAMAKLQERRMKFKAERAMSVNTLINDKRANIFHSVWVGLFCLLTPPLLCFLLFA